MAYDVLEHGGKDIRNKPFSKRRSLLEKLVSEVNNPLLKVSPIVVFDTWEEIEKLKHTAQDIRAGGMVLKHNTVTTCRIHQTQVF